MTNQELIETRNLKGVTSYVKRKHAIKRSLVTHLAGLGESRGLVFKALERANEWLDGDNEELQSKAVDIVIKLLPYVIEKEGVVLGSHQSATGQTVLNVQINNFDSFIRDRIANTNLGKLLGNMELQQTPNVEYEEIIPSGTTFTPPPNPGGMGVSVGTGGRPTEARDANPNTSDGTISK